MKVRFQMPRLFAGPWPDSNAWATKCFLGLIVAAVLCGPIALGFAVGGGRPSPLDAVPAHEERVGESAAVERTAGQDRAKIEATAFVEVWLSSNREQSDRVASFLLQPPEDLQLPTKTAGPVAADAITAEPLDAHHWAITVRSRHHDGTRWWLVDVVIDGDTAAIAALPSQIPAPRRPEPGDHAEPASLSDTHPAAHTATEFLAAMLTGTGDITRWSSPGSDLAPIAPAPCTAIKTAATTATPDPAAVPETGEELDVAVTVTCTTGRESALHTQYGLHLQGRDGRWEVAALNVPTPLHDR